MKEEYALCTNAYIFHIVPCNVTPTLKSSILYHMFELVCMSNFNITFSSP